jgi:hypothetical protein
MKTTDKAIVVGSQYETTLQSKQPEPSLGLKDANAQPDLKQSV